MIKTTDSNIKIINPKPREIDDFSDFAGLVGQYDKQQLSVVGWHPGSDVGGGVFYWDGSQAKSNHNGGTIISPTVPWTTTTADFLDGVGETDSGGTGCWVRKYSNSDPYFFGAKFDGATDDTLSWSLAVSLGGLVMPSRSGNNSLITGFLISQSNLDINLNKNKILGSVSGSMIRFSTGVTDITFRNGSIDGANQATTGINVDGLSQYAIKRIKLSDLKIENISDGIEFNGADELTIDNASLENITGVGIKNVENLVSNPYGSRKIVINNVKTSQIGSHSVSVNSWAYVEDVTVTNCTIKGGTSTGNGLEIWSKKITCIGNKVQDHVLAYSFGASTRLVCIGNEADVTTPAASGPGGIGIEIGACYYYNVSQNIIRGYRTGIYMTSGFLAGGTNIYDISGTKQSQQGVISTSDYDRLQILSSDTQLTGSFYGSITNNVVLVAKNAGISVVQEASYSDSCVVSGNTVSKIGKLVASSGSDEEACIYIENARAVIDDNTIDGSTYGIRSQNGKCELGVNYFRNIDSDCVIGVGSAHQFSISVKQKIDPDSTSSITRELILSRTQGTYDIGDCQIDHTPVAGGNIGEVCTEGGTVPSLSGTPTATGNSADSFFTWAGSVGSLAIGIYIDIVGVTGARRIIDYNPDTLVVDIDAALGANVAGAAITNHAPTFKTFGNIAP